MKTQAVVFTALDEIEIKEVELPSLKEDQILTKSIYTFVSPGTELRTLAGHYVGPNSFPFVPGYSTLSRIIEVGSAVKNYRVGDVISSWAGAQFANIKSSWGGQSAYHVYTGESSHHVILPDLRDEELLPYAITEVAAISCRGVRMANPQKNDNVLVIGQGMIGRFSAEFFRIFGGQVTVGDVDNNRLREAAEAGFVTVDLKDKDAQERLSCYSPNGFDIVVECSGSIPGLKTAYSQIKNPPRTTPDRFLKFPKLVLQASYIDEVSISPTAFFKAEGMIVITPNDRDYEDRKVVEELIRSKKIDTAHYTNNVFTTDGIIGAYRKLQKREISSAVFKWN